VKIKVLAALMACALLGVGCSSGDDGVFDAQTTTTSGDTDDHGDDHSNPQGNVELEVDIDEPIRPQKSAEDREPVANDADAVMIAAAIDVGAFWEDAYPNVYGDELPPLEGGFWSYGPSTPDDELPTCGGPMLYDEIAQNAFYCSIDDLIAWDRDALVEPFIDEWGAFTAALVMAHEYGHAIQARSGDNQTLQQVYLELQADCFAGAWVANVADGNSDIFQATLTELDVALAGLLSIRDVPGSSPDDPSAHGSGFDRVSAFSDGLFDGVERCADYGDVPPVVTQEVFTTEADAASGGNLSPADLLPLLYDDLEDFYTQTFATTGRTWVPVADIVFYDPDADDVACGELELSADEAENAIFYCIDDNLVLADGANLMPTLADIGDFAVATEIARQWAFAAQVQMGNLENTLGTSLHADCLTGLYAGDVFFQLRDSASLQLSPGDLDEAISGFLLGGTIGEQGETGTAFQRTDAFRTGFLGTETDCEALLDEG
jgi:predicted metalloprotease